VTHSGKKKKKDGEKDKMKREGKHRGGHTKRGVR
jgi:hypothetical protein